jgi:hypothetical protein
MKKVKTSGCYDMRMLDRCYVGCRMAFWHLVTPTVLEIKASIQKRTAKRKQ